MPPIGLAPYPLIQLADLGIAQAEFAEFAWNTRESMSPYCCYWMDYGRAIG